MSSTLNNILATNPSQATQGAPKKPTAPLDFFTGAKFTDVLDALVVTPTVENTLNSQPVATQQSSEPLTRTTTEIPKALSNVATTKKSADVTITRLEDKNTILPDVIKVRVDTDAKPDLDRAEPPTTEGFVAAVEDAKNTILSQDLSYTKIEAVHTAQQDAPVEKDDPAEATSKVEIYAPNEATVLQAASTAPTHVAISLPQQITTRPSKAEELPTDTSIKLDTSLPTQTSRQTVVRPEESSTALPQSLVEHVRNSREAQPIATVEVRHPEERLPFVQLPLSVMQHAPIQPQAQAPLIAITPGHSGPLALGKDAHGEGGSLSSNHDEHGVTQGFSTAKSNSTKAGERSQATPQDKAMMQEMIDRIRDLVQGQRQDMKVTVQHAEYGPVTMNLRFTNQKQVNAVFMSDNEDLLKLLQGNHEAINQVFQNSGVTCQQQHVRRV